jgi:hypothetical protein
MMVGVTAAWRVILLIVVLIQYTPVRACALERLVDGASCHDREAQNDDCGGPAVDTQPAGDPVGERHQCVCERPKVVGPHSVVLKHDLDVPQPIDAVIELSISLCGEAVPPIDASPPAVPNARQLPLLS